MTRTIRVLQMFDMFSYHFFKNATEEDMQRMQYLLLYVGINKARERPATFIGTCKIIDSIFNGRIPDTIEDWMGFPNVGRKIAALIMNDGLGIYLFLVVDTHLKKVLPVLDWTEKKNANDMAIDIEKWLNPKLLKETNESIVGIRQLYKDSTQSEQYIIRTALDKNKTFKYAQLLVGITHK